MTEGLNSPHDMQSEQEVIPSVWNSPCF